MSYQETFSKSLVRCPLMTFSEVKLDLQYFTHFHISKNIFLKKIFVCLVLRTRAEVALRHEYANQNSKSKDV